MLTPEKLANKYNQDQHPVLTRSQWMQEVHNKRTLRGYWHWVATQIEEAIHEVRHPRWFAIDQNNLTCLGHHSSFAQAAKSSPPVPLLINEDTARNWLRTLKGELE